MTDINIPLPKITTDQSNTPQDASTPTKDDTPASRLRPNRTWSAVARGLSSTAKKNTPNEAPPATVAVVEVPKFTSPHQRNLGKLSQMEDKFNEGYDSDGEAGPFCSIEDIEGPQDFDEEPLKTTLASVSAKNTTINPVDNPNEDAADHTNKTDKELMQHVAIEMAQVLKFTRTMLVAELKKQTRPIHGNKTTLQA